MVSLGDLISNPTLIKSISRRFLGMLFLCRLKKTWISFNFNPFYALRTQFNITINR
ncbi:hypothetical protein P872_16500 [Rhodonellum psychrophilum GCM71 = DSM 17998]|uniref:Uncharacterized protein n=1 Tax=Rhodonellum psychrophilum GCM71 = DSM 17998 TaxID=1123057 RepID=U5BZL2_9BACT|nr:hypothetical protein P872_16500 [Rhodonellum psychrophilum GCM71 = DSM 17998]